MATIAIALLVGVTLGNILLTLLDSITLGRTAPALVGAQA